MAMDKANGMEQTITPLQLNNTDLSHMMKEQCIPNDSLKGENIALPEQLACTCAELSQVSDFTKLATKLVQVTAELQQLRSNRRSFEVTTEKKTRFRLRDLHHVTTTNGKPVEVVKSSGATITDLS